ncbi:hypothetical protein HQ576_16145 [bacterium]|nr:hypothetical protein [bacterium]
MDVAGQADISRVTEPWYLVFEAEVEPCVAMVPEELAKIGMEELTAKYGG